MRKIALFIVGVLVSVSGVFAGSIDQVLKVYNYKYDALNDTYYIYSQGSAVLINEDTIVTNAHVVLDEDNVPLENYEICKTIDFKKTPVCFSV